MHWKGSDKFDTNYLARLIAYSYAFMVWAEGESDKEWLLEVFSRAAS